MHRPGIEPGATAWKAATKLSFKNWRFFVRFGDEGGFLNIFLSYLTLKLIKILCKDHTAYAGKRENTLRIVHKEEENTKQPHIPGNRKHYDYNPTLKPTATNSNALLQPRNYPNQPLDNPLTVS